MSVNPVPALECLAPKYKPLVAKPVGVENVFVPKLTPSLYKVTEFPLTTKSQICIVLIPETAKEASDGGLPTSKPVVELK